ncbi:MAG: ABC transporter ATP-binding protein, partial [Anaerolineaceae bacterium]|nr:ABC transporter ATP-binding protein [Anaerolineaceae bacterium]
MNRENNITGNKPESDLSQEKLLEVKDLTVEFRLDAGILSANANVSLGVNRGKTLGIVGESGSGKSVFCRTILRLLPSPPAYIKSGKVLFNGRDLLECSEIEMQHIRGAEISMIFQDPMSCLNPVFKIGEQISESLRLHNQFSKKEAREVSLSLLRQVGIPSPERRIDDYPHHLSGGMRQRVMIAMAISSKPKLLLADEPTTALDVTIQDQILAMMLQLQEQAGMSIILVSHDLGVVAETSDQVAVMYAGHVMEFAPTTTIFRNPKHPYTVGLIRSIPSMKEVSERLIPIKGQPPNFLKLPEGCPFTERCPVADPEFCLNTPVSLKYVGPEHYTNC